MKIENRTSWDTRDLRSIILRTKNNHYLELPPKIEIRVAKGGRFRGAWTKPRLKSQVRRSRSGLAPNLERCWISIPSTPFQAVNFALAVYDVLEYKSVQDRSLKPLTLKLQAVEWATALTIRPKPPTRVPTKLESAERELKNIDASIKRWNTKLKLANTKLKGLKRRRAFYARQQSKLTESTQ